MKVAVVTDSGSNIYYEGISMPDLFKLPLQITYEDTTYLEGETISIYDTYKMVSENKLLKTSLPPLGRIESLFQELKDAEYDLIFGVCITEGLSGTIPAMISASKMVDIPFEYVDCFTTACVELHLATSACTLFKQGKSVVEVKEILLDAIRHSVTFVIPNDLKHLARGGRLTPLAATLGGLMKIKPILKLDENTGGKIDAFDKVRTMQKAKQRVIDYFKEHNVGKGYKICVTHVFALEEGKAFYEMCKEAFPEAEIYLTDLISTVGVHTGIGCLATQYIKKIDC